MSDIVRHKLLRRARFAGAMVIVLSVALFAWNLATAKNGRLSNGVGVGADYLAFYNAGDILNRFGPTRLYDQTLQYDLYHQRLPGEPSDATLPFANAPQIAMLFRPFASLPYGPSLVAWTTCAIGLYVIGVIAFCAAAGLPGRFYPTVLLIACSFEPFSIENVHGGQISSLAFALLGVGCLLVSRGLRWGGGFVIGCCCYKPTLLLVVVPAFFITRRWRELTGCAGAILAWSGVCILTLGFGPCADHLRLLTHYAADAGAGSGVFRTWKFVDLNAFATLLGLPASAGMTLIGCFATYVAWTLRVSSPATDADDGRRFLAVVLAWTPVVNLYVGLYDAILLVGSVILVAGVLVRRVGDLSPAFVGIVATLWITPWFTSALSKPFGPQVFTLAMIAWGVFVSRLIRPDRAGNELPTPYFSLPVPDVLRE